MAEDTRTFGVLGQSLALDGSQAAASLTRENLERIEANLGKFEASLRKHEAALGNQQDAPAGQGGQQERKRVYHCLVIAGYLGRDYELPGTKAEECTEEEIIRICEKRLRDQQAERIDLILESRGGSLDSAYRIVLYLRNFAKKINVYVPHRAKSAATLIAIGADKVMMSPYGELGPLDTQIADPRNPAALVSALDCYQSVDYVRDFGIESLSRALRVMLEQTQGSIPFSQVMDLATSFAAANVKPMLGQVRALDFGAWGRTLKIGEAYAKALRLRLDEPKQEAEAAKVAKKLVYGYPHHPYPIDIAEARKLGLDVVDMPGGVYRAAKAVADSCQQDARFVGFSATAREAIENFGERKDHEVPAIPRQAAREPVAHEKVSERNPVREATDEYR